MTGRKTPLDSLRDELERLPSYDRMLCDALLDAYVCVCDPGKGEKLPAYLTGAVEKWATTRLNRFFTRGDVTQVIYDLLVTKKGLKAGYLDGAPDSAMAETARRTEQAVETVRDKVSPKRRNRRALATKDK